jgi:membrane protease YdiL (CAAX protease family)
MHEAPATDPAVPGTAISPRELTAAVAPWWHSALLIAMLLGGSLVNAHQTHRSGLAAHHLTRYITGIGVELLLFLVTLWGVRMRRIRIAGIINFRRGELARDLGAAAVFWILAVIVLACIGIALRLLHFETPQKAIAALAPQSALEMLLWIALSATAGFVEEFVFRGYFLRQFASARHALWIGLVGSSLLFGCSHAYEGAAGMIAITVYGALFCGLAILRRTLRPGMIAHAWHDIFTGAMLALAHHLHAL